MTREVVFVDGVRTASGARVGIFTMKELVRRDGRYGMFFSCCCGGHGVSTLIENLRI